MLSARCAPSLFTPPPRLPEDTEYGRHIFHSHQNSVIFSAQQKPYQQQPPPSGFHASTPSSRRLPVTLNEPSRCDRLLLRSVRSENVAFIRFVYRGENFVKRPSRPASRGTPTFPPVLIYQATRAQHLSAKFTRMFHRNFKFRRIFPLTVLHFLAAACVHCSRFCSRYQNSATPPQPPRSASALSQSFTFRDLICRAAS